LTGVDASLGPHGGSQLSDPRPEIRRVLRDHGRLPVDVDSFDDHTDLFLAGMTSHASVNVMLALEDAFDVEFPDEMLKRSVFETVAGIAAAIGALQTQAA
jgi:acyl carrier protein